LSGNGNECKPLAGGTLTGKYFEKTKPDYAAKDAAERPLVGPSKGL
jgi:hypothetical protein